MSKVREFKLINEFGEEYSLMDIENYCLLTEPTGFGYSYLSEYEQLGNTFVNKLRKLEQGEITGIANFSKYDNYKKLVDFVEKSEQLRFSYKIPFEDETKEYFKDIEIQSMSKTEKQTNGVLSEAVVFNCLSLWYEQTTVIYKIEQLENEIRWDFRWDSRFTDYSSRKFECVNLGHVEAPVLIEINGSVIKPKIELFIDNQLYQTIEFNTTIEEYEKLLYCSKENEFYMLRQKVDGSTEDLLDLDIIDYPSDLVLRLPKNKSCKIQISAENEVLNAQITVLIYYKSV